LAENYIQRKNELGHQKTDTEETPNKFAKKSVTQAAVPERPVKLNIDAGSEPEE
jgi:hypothetical protein